MAAEKHLVSPDRYLQILNEELQKHKFYEEGMEFRVYPETAAERKLYCLSLIYSRPDKLWVLAQVHEAVDARFFCNVHIPYRYEPVLLWSIVPP